MDTEWLRAHMLPLILLGAYGLLLVHHARTGRRDTKNITDFFVGGRAMGGIVLGMSFFATYASTNVFVGLAGPLRRRLGVKDSGVRPQKSDVPRT